MGNASLPRFMKESRGREDCWRWEIGGRNREELIAAGFKSCDLKDAAGQWLPFKDAKALANDLNAAIDRWRAGGEAQPNITPRPITSGGRLTVSGLIAAWQASEVYRAGPSATRDNRASHMRALGAVLGDIAPASIAKPAALGFYSVMLDFAHWKAATAEGRNEPTPPRIADFLALPKALRSHWRDQRFAAMEEAEGQPTGHTMAFHTSASARQMWAWALGNVQGFTTANPFRELGLPGPAGRVRRITDEELAAIDQASIDIGMPDLGDAFALGVLTCQRRADLCRMSWDIRRTGRVDLVQQKTKARVDFRAPQALLQRLDQIWERHRREGVKRMDRILINRFGKAYDEPEELTRYLSRLRARAAQIVPSCADIVLHDSRDTAVILLLEAGCDLARAAEHSGHTLRALDMIKRAYFGRNRVLADQATDALDAAWAKKQGGK